jgi:hypothetical protein
MKTAKKNIMNILISRDLNYAIKEIILMNPRKVINPLISLLCSPEPEIRWKAIRCGGEVVSGLAKHDLESARVIMRRLMWQLNDESGGIGWGVPEMMGEIMYLNHDMAKEYINILISYIRKDGNYLENELLQQGVLWAIGRVSERWSELGKNASGYIIPLLSSESPSVRGTALWVSSILKIKDSCPFIGRLMCDMNTFQLYMDSEIRNFKVGEMALSASRLIPCKEDHYHAKDQ